MFYPFHPHPTVSSPKIAPGRDQLAAAGAAAAPPGAHAAPGARLRGGAPRARGRAQRDGAGDVAAEVGRNPGLGKEGEILSWKCHTFFWGVEMP